jgi:hypothetical protein
VAYLQGLSSNPKWKYFGDDDLLITINTPRSKKSKKFKLRVTWFTPDWDSPVKVPLSFTSSRCRGVSQLKTLRYGGDPKGFSIFGFSEFFPP